MPEIGAILALERAARTSMAVAAAAEDIRCALRWIRKAHEYRVAARSIAAGLAPSIEPPEARISVGRRTRLR